MISFAALYSTQLVSDVIERNTETRFNVSSKRLYFHCAVYRVQRSWSVVVDILHVERTLYRCNQCVTYILSLYITLHEYIILSFSAKLSRLFVVWLACVYKACNKLHLTTWVRGGDHSHTFSWDFHSRDWVSHLKHYVRVICISCYLSCLSTNAQVLFLWW